MLAYGLLRGAVGLLAHIEKEVGPDRAASASRTFDSAGVFAEILCANYCLAVAVLSHDEFAAQPDLWKIYTARTFDELKVLLAEMNLSAPVENIIDEAIELYLHDKPSLVESVKMMREFMLGAEIDIVSARGDWTSVFLLKAQTRILRMMDLRSREITSFLEITDLSKAHYIQYLRLVLRKLRPVLAV